MSENWIKISPEELDIIEDTIHQTMAALPDLGYVTTHRRFPYSLHHEYYKNKLKLNNNKKPRHEDIGSLLHQWASEQPDPVHAYVWQAIAGAMRNLTKNKNVYLPEFIELGIAQVSKGDNFETWARNHLKNINLVSE